MHPCGMDLEAVIKTLKAARDSTYPKTPKAAATFSGKVADGLKPLREWLDETRELLDSVEAEGDELAGAEKEDREDFHANLVATVAAIADSLAELGIKVS